MDYLAAFIRTMGCIFGNKITFMVTISNFRRETRNGGISLLGAQEESLSLVSLTPNWLPQMNYFFEVYMKPNSQWGCPQR